MHTHRTTVAGVALLLACGTAVLTPQLASASSRGVLVVDDDRSQCPAARYTAIADALSEARRGDTVRVCGGTYAEDVDVTTSVKLIAQTPAAPANDCLSLIDAPFPATIAVITGSVVVTADNVLIDGLAVTSPPSPAPRTAIGITTSEHHSGYVIHRSVVQEAGQFGIELQSNGEKPTVVEKNCLRRNGTVDGERAGLAAESGALRNAVIRRNITADNFEAISVAGPHEHADISITDNVLRRESVGIFVSGVVVGTVSRNDIDSTGVAAVFSAIGIGGGNIGLVVDRNSIIGGTPAISVNRNANVTNPDPNVGVVITSNRIQNTGSGINVTFPDPGALPNLSNGLIYRNHITGSRNSGILVASGNNGNVLVGNRITGSARNGIWLAAVPGLPTVAGTIAVGNTMLQNGIADARDDDRSNNTWNGNRCVTQLPLDANICHGDPVARASETAAPAIQPVPAVDQRQWPCLKVPYFEMDPVGTGAWSWISVVAPDAPPGTYCGS